MTHSADKIRRHNEHIMLKAAEKSRSCVISGNSEDARRFAALAATKAKELGH